MKKIFFILCIFLGFSSFSYANTYFCKESNYKFIVTDNGKRIPVFGDKGSLVSIKDLSTNEKFILVSYESNINSSNKIDAIKFFKSNVLNKLGTLFNKNIQLKISCRKTS